jgi:hypothetical protein
MEIIANYSTPMPPCGLFLFEIYGKRAKTEVRF